MDASHAIHFARVDFRNDDRAFGIKNEDRFSHVYVIGKTGTGKSTLLETMALQDRNAAMVLLSLIRTAILSHASRRVFRTRTDNVIYLNATDPIQPYGYNPLRHVSEDRIALAASGMMDVFKKMWPDAWGVRMEHILRNVLDGTLSSSGVRRAAKSPMKSECAPRRRWHHGRELGDNTRPPGQCRS